MIDPTKLFDIFDDHDGGAEGGAGVIVIDNIADLPEYKLGMFTKVIVDHKRFSRKIMKFFKKDGQKEISDDLEFAGEFVVYNRGWFYIKDIDVNEFSHQYAIEKASDLNLITALKLAIHYFEEREEYEKCAHILQIQKKAEDFQK